MNSLDSRIPDTQKLLDIYRTCIWSLSDSAQNIKDILVDSCLNTLIESPQKLSVNELFKAISDYDINISGKPVEWKMKSFSKTYRFVQMIDNALIRLHAFPVYGDKYFNILYELYFNTNSSVKPNADSVMDKLNYYDTKVFYSYRKKAIRLFNSILWDSYQSDLQDFMPIAEEMSSSFGWISQNALEYNRYKA